MKPEDKAALAGRVAKGEISLRKVDDLSEPNEAVEIRRLALELMTGKKLPQIGSAKMDYGLVKGKNAENVIGSAIIPMGIVGPVKVSGDYAKGEFYVPFTTTEGALIAGVNRGANAIGESGGVTSRVIAYGMTRAPVFALDSVAEAANFVKWLDSHDAEIKEVAESTTAHGKLTGMSSFVTGNNVWIRFAYERDRRRDGNEHGDHCD